MGLVADIGRSLRRGPRAVVREHLSQGTHETRALAFLMIACGLVFVAQWPRLVRRSTLEGIELERLLAYEMLAWLIVWPLVFYLVAGLAHVVSRATGGRGTGYGARLALFWSWLAAVPLGLLTALLSALDGPGVPAMAASVAWMAVFLLFWWQSQREAARGDLPHG